MIKYFLLNLNEKNEFQILPLDKKVDKKTSIMWGTYRSLINNAITGVSQAMKNFKFKWCWFQSKYKR